MTAYIVTGELVTAQVTTEMGSTVLGFLKGAVLPPSVPAETVAHLLDVNLIAAVGEPVAATAGPLGQQPAVSPPAGNASLEAWRDFARTQGMSEADLDGLTRDELRERFAAK